MHIPLAERPRERVQQACGGGLGAALALRLSLRSLAWWGACWLNSLPLATGPGDHRTTRAGDPTRVARGAALGAVGAVGAGAEGTAAPRGQEGRREGGRRWGTDAPR